MKNYKYPLYALPVGLFALASCSDFEEVNTNPTAANIEQVRIEYASLLPELSRIPKWRSVALC